MPCLEELKNTSSAIPLSSIVVAFQHQGFDFSEYHPYSSWLCGYHCHHCLCNSIAMKACKISRLGKALQREDCQILNSSPLMKPWLARTHLDKYNKIREHTEKPYISFFVSVASFSSLIIEICPEERQRELQNLAEIISFETKFKAWRHTQGAVLLHEH